MVKKDNLNINMNARLEPKTLVEYVERWRRMIWNQAFGPTLKGSNAFKKSYLFNNFDGSKDAVKRVLFWYVFELKLLITTMFNETPCYYQFYMKLYWIFH